MLRIPCIIRECARWHPCSTLLLHACDGLVEAVEVRDRSFIMGVQWHPKFFAGTRKMGCLFASLAQEAIRSHTATVDARGRCRLNIKKAPDARSWPTMEYADGI